MLRMQTRVSQSRIKIRPSGVDRRRCKPSVWLLACLRTDNARRSVRCDAHHIELPPAELRERVSQYVVPRRPGQLRTEVQGVARLGWRCGGCSAKWVVWLSSP